MTWILLFAFVLFGLLVRHKPTLGIYLTILLLPTYQIRFEILSIPMTFLEGLILIQLILHLFNLATTNGLNRFYSKEVLNQKTRTALIFLFILASTASVFIAPDLQRAAGLWKAFIIEPILFFFLMIELIDTKKKLENLFHSFALLVLYLGVFGLFQFFSLVNLPFSWWAVDVASRRIVSLLNHPNALALLIGPLLAMIIVHILTNKDALKSKLYWSAASLGLLALFLSFSRAGWLALVITVVGFGFFTKYKKFVTISALITILMILAVPFAREKIVSLVQGRDLAQENRIVLWTAAADIIKNNPLGGVGLQGFREAYKSYPLGPDKVVQNYPHNFFLNFWVELGLIGLVSVIGLIVLYYKQTWLLLKRNKELSLVFSAGITMIVLHGMADVPYFKNDLAVLFWVIMSLPYLHLETKTT